MAVPRGLSFKRKCRYRVFYLSKHAKDAPLLLPMLLLMLACHIHRTLSWLNNEAALDSTCMSKPRCCTNVALLPSAIYQPSMHPELLPKLPGLRTGYVPLSPPRHKKVYCVILLLLSGDVSRNPGPSSIHATSADASLSQCGLCTKPVTWEDKGIVCDECSQWHHAACQGIHSRTFSVLEKEGSFIWKCLRCDGTNYSSICFDLHGISTSNAYDNISELDTLGNLDMDGSPVDGIPPKPRHSSTPSKTRATPSRAKAPLRTLNVNFQSIKGKRPLVENLLESTKPDVVFGTETWIDGSVSDNQIFPSNFKLYRKDRNLEGGGVLVAVRNEIPSSAVPELDSNCEIVWCKIEQEGQEDLFLGTFYNPATANTMGYEEMDRSLSNLASMPRKKKVLLAGDFNLPGWNWEDGTLKPGSPCVQNHRLVTGSFDDNGLTQLVTKPTRGKNTLDLVATNVPQLCNRVEILPPVADHDIVFTEFNISPHVPKQKKRKIQLFKKADWDSLKSDIRDADTKIRSMKADGESTNSLWEQFKDKLNESIQRHVPQKTIGSRNRKPWVSARLRRLIKKKDRAHRRMRKTGHDRDRKTFKALKRDVQCLLRRAYWRHVEDIVSDVSDDNERHGTRKRFWSFIKHQRADSQGISPLKSEGSLHQDPAKKAEILNHQFESAFSTASTFTSKEFEERCGMVGTYPAMQDFIVTEEGVRNRLMSLNPHKAPGPDSIRPLVLKECAREVAPIFTTIFNSSLETGRVPDDWKLAHVAPVFKKGEKYKAENYRPVSLTCVACKVMEHIITSQVMRHANNLNILHPMQHGFRKGVSTETQLIEFLDDLATNLDKGRQTDCIILDFAKAFDKVNHSLLTHKLHHYGVRGQTLRWIEDFLANRRQAVVVDGEKSSLVNVQSGVPQGSVLGPALFLFYINDLPDSLKGQCRLFADDTISYMIINKLRDALVLQSDLDKLNIWEETWLMKFHPKKCTVLTVSNKRSTILHDYTLHGHTLERVASANYLGVTITGNLKWAEHISRICKKANSTLAFLRRNLNIKNQALKANAYKALVRPQLEYGCAAWDPHHEQDITELERIQRRAARYVSGNYDPRASVTAMLQHLGWQSLEQRRQHHRLCILFKARHHLMQLNTGAYLQHPARATRHATSNTYRVPSSRTDIHKTSYFPRTIRDWNCLGEEIRNLEELDSFKLNLQ